MIVGSGVDVRFCSFHGFLAALPPGFGTHHLLVVHHFPSEPHVEEQHELVILGEFCHLKDQVRLFPDYYPIS